MALTIRPGVVQTISSFDSSPYRIFVWTFSPTLGWEYAKTQMDHANFYKIRARLRHQGSVNPQNDVLVQPVYFSEYCANGIENSSRLKASKCLYSISFKCSTIEEVDRMKELCEHGMMPEVIYDGMLLGDPCILGKGQTWTSTWSPSSFLSYRQIGIS